MELCTECIASDETYSLRAFVWVDKGEIKRERPQTEVSTLKVSWGYHQFQVVGLYQLNVLRLSCFCVQCLAGKARLCKNASYTTGDFKAKCLVLQDKGRANHNDIGNKNYWFNINKLGGNHHFVPCIADINHHTAPCSCFVPTWYSSVF